MKTRIGLRSTQSIFVRQFQHNVPIKVLLYLWILCGCCPSIGVSVIHFLSAFVSNTAFNFNIKFVSLIKVDTILIKNFVLHALCLITYLMVLDGTSIWLLNLKNQRIFSNCMYNFSDNLTGTRQNSIASGEWPALSDVLCFLGRIQPRRVSILYVFNFE